MQGCATHPASPAEVDTVMKRLVRMDACLRLRVVQLRIANDTYLFGGELVKLERTSFVVNHVALFVPLGWQQALISQRTQRQRGLQVKKQIHDIIM